MIEITEILWLIGAGFGLSFLTGLTVWIISLIIKTVTSWLSNET